MNAAADVWSRPALLGQVLKRRCDGRAEVALHVDTLAEPRRALRLEEALRAVPAVTSMSFDPVARRARLVFDDAELPLRRLLAACARAGCAARPLQRERLDDADRAMLNAALKRLLVAGVFAMQAMMFALVLYIGVLEPLDGTTTQLFRWLTMLAAIPVIGYAAWPFHRDALAGLRARRPGIDLPIAIAIALIFAASVGNTIRGSGEIYFDSISMLVFVLLLGRYLQLRARTRHRALGELAADGAPLTACRIAPDGTTETVAVAELATGDRIRVAEGEAVPCDGALVGERGEFDESLLSGESRPRMHVRGDAIVAGSVAVGGPAEIQATRSAAASTTAVLARLAALAHSARELVVDADDAAARRFVLRVLVLALAAAAFWLCRDPARMFGATVAVLVVACPCAFGLAAPAALTRAMAVLAHHGVLVVRPGALAALADADRLLLDKTGTLTEPAVRVRDVETFGGFPGHDAIVLAAALARTSRHPLAAALVRAAGDVEVPDATQARVVPGQGLRGIVAGRGLWLGRAGFARAAAGADDDALWLSDAGGPLARFPVDEAIRPGVADAVARLRGDGLAPAIVSGDAPVRVAAAAARLGVDDWAARQSASAKLARVRLEQGHGRTVLAVGDGGNDAVAFAGADVAVAVAEGTDLARSHADLVLLRGLAHLVPARALARRARAIVVQNRRWSLAWNLGAVPFAALGFVPPWLAALGMAASSLAVVLNSLRVRVPQESPSVLRKCTA